MAHDNWGRRARFGIFIVAAEAVPEAEWWAMAPRGVSIHAARVTSATPWAEWNQDRTGVTLSPDLERGADQFANMALDIVTVAHSSSSVLGGAGWDEAVTAELKKHLHPNTQITTNGMDCAFALQTLGAFRPFLVFPPWFGEAFAQKSANYLSRFGLDPSGTLLSTPEDRWSCLAPSELYANFMHLHQRPDLLHKQILSNCPETADSVLLIGTGLRCVGIIERLEAHLKRPVVTANQASLWRCLRLAGMSDGLPAYGSLLAREG